MSCIWEGDKILYRHDLLPISRYFDYEGSSMTARVDPRTTARTGDIVKFALDAEKIHIFDKETQVTITN